jgi:hypothetical protein
VALWRYPVKSTLGEELNAAEVTERGLAGDRAYALVDRADGKVATAKNPRKWPTLFEYRAAFATAPRPGAPPPPVWITLPDGAVVTSEQTDLDHLLSRALGRDVAFQATQRRRHEEVKSASPNPNPWRPVSEEYWPDLEELEYRDTVTDFELPTGAFFDCAVVHLLTTATLDQLRAAYPQGRFEIRRFRPNLVVALAGGGAGFAEDAWIGRTLAIGDTLRLHVDGPCPRCVMTTLAQGDLPKDAGILRAAAQQHQANVGVYVSVLRGGAVRRGDAIRLMEA